MDDSDNSSVSSELSDVNNMLNIDTKTMIKELQIIYKTEEEENKKLNEIYGAFAFVDFQNFSERILYNSSYYQRCFQPRQYDENYTMSKGVIDDIIHGQYNNIDDFITKPYRLRTRMEIVAYAIIKKIMFNYNERELKVFLKGFSINRKA